jgi:hypothetical protein
MEVVEVLLPVQEAHQSMEEVVEVLFPVLVEHPFTEDQVVRDRVVLE